tara:strand:+ start:2365 stop:3606 length:1242 start_codon:yes stop_codon:yes gene_type:complete
MSSNIQIPMIFDVSANGTVYGEDISGDEIITSHINLRVIKPDKHAEASSQDFINAMSKILYSDSPENDVSGILFYKDDNVADVAGTIGTAIKNLLLSGQKLVHDGTTGIQGTAFGEAIQGNTGIPIGFKQKYEHDNDNSTDEFYPAHSSSWYNSSFIDNDGAEMHRVLIRVASAHLMGHPFAQAFIQENTVENDLSNTNFSLQVQTNMLTGDDGVVLKSVSLDASVNKTDGKSNAILQTIYEQLLRVNLSLMSVQDDDGFIDQDISGVARSLRFAMGNTVTFFIRPRMFFALDLAGGISELTHAVGSVIGVSGTTFGTTTGVSGNEVQKAAIFNDIFKTTGGAKATGFKWLVGASDGTQDHSGNHDGVLNQYGTNLRWADVSGEVGSGTTPDLGIAMLDAHIWKIRITLGENQ